MDAGTLLWILVIGGGLFAMFFMHCGGHAHGGPGAGAASQNEQTAFIAPSDAGRRLATEGPSKEVAMRRPPINITPSERLVRVAVGRAGAIAGVWLLTSVGGVGLAILEVLLVLAGLDLVVTGVLGRPLYRRLGYVPRSLREAGTLRRSAVE